MATREPGITLLANTRMEPPARFTSPLAAIKKHIYEQMGPDVFEIEKKVVYVSASWGYFPRISAAKDVKAAIKNHDAKLEEKIIYIYTDGLAIKPNNHLPVLVGAAAFCVEIYETKKCLVGPFARHIVYCGETHALCLAINQVKQLDKCLPVYIFVDNRGAVQAAGNPLAKCG